MQAFTKLNLVIYNVAIFLLNPSKRKDGKGEVLTQICEKYLSRVCIALLLLRFEIFDHCIHSSTGEESIQGKISKSTPVKKHLLETPDPQIASRPLSGWEIINPYWANFLWQNYSASVNLIHFKFGTVKDIFMVNVSIVLEILFLVFLAGK